MKVTTYIVKIVLIQMNWIINKTYNVWQINTHNEQDNFTFGTKDKKNKELNLFELKVSAEKYVFKWDALSTNE